MNGRQRSGVQMSHFHNTANELKSKQLALLRELQQSNPFKKCVYATGITMWPDLRIRMIFFFLNSFTVNT